MSPIKEPCYFAYEFRLKNCDALLRPAAERSQRELKRYFAKAVLTERFGAMVYDWPDYPRLFERRPGRDRHRRGHAGIYVVENRGAQYLRQDSRRQNPGSAMRPSRPRVLAVSAVSGRYRLAAYISRTYRSESEKPAGAFRHRLSAFGIRTLLRPIVALLQALPSRTDLHSTLRRLRCGSGRYILGDLSLSGRRPNVRSQCFPTPPRSALAAASQVGAHLAKSRHLAGCEEIHPSRAAAWCARSCRASTSR